MVLIGTATEEKENFMPAAWASPLSFKPPLFGVAISPKRYTYDAILASEEFTVNYCTLEMADIVARTGEVSGKIVNKKKKFNIKTRRGEVVKAPVVEGCYAHLECKLKDYFEVGDHFFFVGEVLKFSHDLRDFKPLIYLWEDTYTTISDVRILKPREK